MVETELSLSSYSFIDKKNEVVEEIKMSIVKEEDKIKNHPDFKKYFTMLKFGVPKEGIKNKLLLDGLDVSIIDIEPDSQIPSNLINYKQTETLDGLNFKEVSLNEVSYIQKLKRNKDKNVPTLEDILAIKQT